MTEIPNLICSNAAVGGNFKSTRDTLLYFNIDLKCKIYHKYSLLAVIDIL